LSTGPAQPPGRVPTLTEVVVLPDSAPAPLPLPLEADVMAQPAMSAPSASQRAPLNDEEIIQSVVADLQHQVDLMLEYRMREILTPILTRAADAVIRDARTELASTLRDLVARAVAQELARHRGR